MSAFPDAATIFRWYKNPNDPDLIEFVNQFEPPKVPYNFPVAGPRESIKFTLRLLVNTTPPFDKGKPRPIHDATDQPSLFWPILAVEPEENKVPDPVTGKRTETIAHEYGFDASGALTVYSYWKRGFEFPYKDRYTWPLANRPRRSPVFVHGGAGELPQAAHQPLTTKRPVAYTAAGLNNCFFVVL